MGRKKPSGRTPKAQADAKKRTVRDIYSLGRRARAYVKKNPGWRALRAFTDLEREHISTVRKAQQLAEDFDDLDWFCDQRDSSGEPLGWTWATELLRIPKADRRSLLASALNAKLSRAEFGLLITHELGEKRSLGGRALKGPETAQGRLLQLANESEQWCRRFSQVWASADGGLKLEGLTEGKGRTELAQVRTLVTRAHQVLAEVQEFAKRAETRLKQIERKLRV